MYFLSPSSETRLSTCCSDLQRVVRTLLKVFDVKVIWGFRSQEEQDKAFDDGVSTKKFPDSMHNMSPSEGVDIVPYPQLYDAPREKFVQMAGLMIGIGISMDIVIRWGGDWDMDTDLHDQKFMDLAHFETVT